MKKFLTFSNFMVLLGIMTIFFYFIPAVKISPRTATTYSLINLFTASFGGNFVIKDYLGVVIPHGPLQACGGLIVAFIFALLGIIFTFLRCKNKFANLLAFPFYLTSGILVACTAPLVNSVNDKVISSALNYSMSGGAIAVCVFYFILAFFALAEFIATIARPKVQQQPEAY